MMEWQPIETAPKDKTPVLLWDGKMQCIALCYVVNNVEYWHRVESSWYDDCEHPTHWMPLPEPPKE